MHRLRLLALTLGIVGSATSCAVTTPGVAPGSRSMPAARLALAPEHRIFYDALSDYGDWILIEPYGHLFRPRTAHHTWRPYEQGFWSPSDNFGWVWISSEPFGWATYHYGRWFHDTIQGWLWRPGSQWGPAWVSWAGNDRYFGWTPLGLDGSRTGAEPIPGGAYSFVAVEDLGVTNPRLLRAGELGDAVADVRPVTTTVTVDGAVAPAGPAFERIERLTRRPLRRAALEDLLAPVAEPDPSAPAPPAAPLVDREVTRRAGEAAAREARRSQSLGRAPQVLPLVRPGLNLPRPAADTTRTRVER